MGTRCLTIFHDGETIEDPEIVVMYRQMDGYPDGHGLDLANFLRNGTLVNGIGFNDKKVFNGMGCLAAQVVSYFKEEAGGFYLHAAGTRDAGEDYIYHIYGTEGYIPTMEVFDADEKTLIFKGPADKFHEFIEANPDS